MFLNNIKTAIRRIFINKLYSTINILGLATGLAISILIIMFVRHESAFDSMYDDSDRIYRIGWENNGTGARFATFFNPVSPMMAEALSEDVEQTTRLLLSTNLITIDDKKQFETFTYVDPNFFEMFHYEKIDGADISNFTDVSGAILTQAAAEILFGSENPIGRVFTVNGVNDFQVRSVISNSPDNSHFVSNIFLTMDSLLTVENNPNFFDSMFSDQLYHYIKLVPGIDVNVFKEKSMDFLVQNLSSEARQSLSIFFQPLRDIHFTTDLQNEMSVIDSMTGVSKLLRNKSDIYIFAIVALMIIIIATFNFMNMQIAQSAKRVKEIGVRKTLGADTKSIFGLFLVESLTMAFIAFLGTLVLIELLTPSFSGLLGVPLSADVLYHFDSMVQLLFIVLVLGILSGLYPALFLSRLDPNKALRGEIMQGVGSAKIRTALVVLQFAVAIGLISASGVVNNQIDFVLKKPLGYDPENVLVVTNLNTPVYEAMRQTLINNPNIVSVSAGSVIPTEDLSDGGGFSILGGDPDFRVSTRSVRVAEQYFSTLGMEFIAGRALSDDFEADRMPRMSPQNPTVSGGVVLNERAAIAAGFSNPADAVGKSLFTNWNQNGTDYRIDYHVVGVVKDIYFGSLRTEIVPVSFTLSSGFRTMVVKAKDGYMQDVATTIDNLWSEIVPEYPIRRNFLQDTYAGFYAVEGKTLNVFIGFSGIAILIACFGLYGLASFVAESRVKEVGIRKVMGASVMQIVLMLSWEFSKLVLIANFIAWPTAYLLMNDWLTSFVYRIDLGLAPFIFAGVITFVLAWLTTSSRGYAVAKINPIYALKHE